MPSRLKCVVFFVVVKTCSIAPIYIHVMPYVCCQGPNLLNYEKSICCSCSRADVRFRILCAEFP